MNFINQSLLLILPVLLLFNSCNKEADVAPTNDNEAITTATLQLTNASNTTEVITATVENLNTNADFSKATLTLKPNTTYNARVLLTDKTKTPVLDISANIKQEANEHLFVFTPTTGLNLTVTITDKDTNPAPGPFLVGLESQMKTGPASSGKLRVVLRHQPNTKNGTATPGTTDLDTNFDVIVR
jgi:hypothetical protein